MRDQEDVRGRLGQARDRTSSSRPGAPGRSTSAIRPICSRRVPDGVCGVVRRRRESVLARGGSRRASGCSTSVPARAPTRSSPRRWSGPGHVTGIDMTPEMLAKARAAAAEMGVANVEFVESEAERLPFDDASFDVVISNGVIDLIPDKDAVFAELYRVLDPAGGSRSPTSRSRTRSPRKASATSTSGPAELPGLCWRQSTPSSSNGTASSGSRPATSSIPTPARPPRTLGARLRSSAPAAPP